MKASRRHFAFFPMIALPFVTVFLIACGDDNPLTAAAEEEESHARNDATYCRNNGGTWNSYYGECNYRSSSSGYCTYSLYGVCYDSEYNRCLNNGGRWDSYYYECNYGYYSSSSSYSTTSYYYTTTQKTMRITTTSYRQTTYDWDVFDNAGDPEISYKVVFTKKDGTTSTSYTSSHFLGTDTRSYASEFHDDVTVPVNTSYFYIYPKVVDRDVSYNDDKSSGYGFGWENVGYTKTGQLHSETDNKGGYSLSFNWQFL